MKTKQIVYTIIVLLAFATSFRAGAQPRQRQRSVTINQVVVDGKVVSADTLITETDTTIRTISSKEVGMELPYTKGATVHIENTYRKLIIHQSKDNKVRLSTTAYYYNDSAFTNAQWLDKMNIHMQSTDTGIVIRSGTITNSTGTGSTVVYGYSLAGPPATPVPPGTTIATGTQNTTTVTGHSLSGRTVTSTSPARGFSYYTNGVNVYNQQGSFFYSGGGMKQELTIYLPAGATLNVSSKYADVSVDHDVTAIKATITNASLEMANAATANINSTYGNITTGTIENATIALTSGKLRMKTVNQLQLITRYAKIEADNCRTLTIKSVSDDYDIGEVKELSGEKAYGNLRIEKLTGSANLKASSADIKFRNIEPTVSVVTIEDKYADVRLPVTALKNYEVIFSGQYSSVFAPFERKEASVASETSLTPVPTTGYRITTTASGHRIATKASGTGTPDRNNNFTAAVGDLKGMHTVFNLTCASCNVDFK